MIPFVYIAHTYWQGIKRFSKNDKQISDKIDYNVGLLTKRKLPSLCHITFFILALLLVKNLLLAIESTPGNFC